MRQTDTRRLARITFAAALGLAMWGLTMWGLTPTAQAQQGEGGLSGVLRPSSLYSFGGGASMEHGFGLNLDYRIYPDHRLPLFLGPFAQGQWETGDAFRVAAGLHLGFGMFGLQLGVSHRTESGDLVASTGLHLAKTVTFGPVSVGGRLTLPLMEHRDLNSPGAATRSQGIEGAVVVSMGWDFVLQGQRPASMMGCHGRHGRGGHGHR